MPGDTGLARLHDRIGPALLRLETISAGPVVNGVALCTAVLLYFVLTALASFRQLWHDELYTLYIATAHGWPRFWEEMHLDLNPPLEYLLARGSTSLFGQSSYVLRLPSILAFLAGSLCLWQFVRRRLSASYGLLALLTVWASPFFYYATEARPYALLMGFLGLTLLSWEYAVRPGRTILSVCLLALSVTGMMLSHMMAVLYVTPFCFAELARSYRRRRLDIPLWLSLLVPCAIPFIYVHLMSRFEASVFPPVFQASVRRIFESYYGSLRLEALPLLIAFLLALCVSPRPGRLGAQIARPITAADIALAAGLLAIPALVNVVLMRSHGAYFDRYALPVSFGYGLVIVYILAIRTNVSQFAALLFSGVLLAFVCAFNLGPGLKQSVWAHRSAKAPDVYHRILRRTLPDLPLVAASGLTFLEMDHYEDPATVGRLFYLTDRQKAIQYANATIFEGLPALTKYFPIRAHVVPFSEFVAKHHRFLVLGTPDYPEDWLIRELLDTRETVQYIGNIVSPYKDAQIYEVTMAEF